MAEIIVAIVGIFVTPTIEIGKVIAAPIKRQYNYLCCYDSNIQRLTEETQKLENARIDMQSRKDRATGNTNITFARVDEWLEALNQIRAKTSAIEVEITNVQSGCLAIKSRYLLSKKAKKTADAMKDLRESCPLVEDISVPAPPAPMEPATSMISPASMAPLIPQGPLDEFPSRKQIGEKIMEDLRGGNIHMMGICGMGGVGKTTMAKRIMNKVREENLFDEVVMAVVSQPVDQRKIQGEIAEWLGLDLKEDSLSARAYKLRVRLMEGNSILLILDDVWKGLNLEELGIPCKSDVGGGCTIVLTSRNKKVLNKMKAEPYAMEILSEEEAWSLFREKVGTCLDDSDLISIAKEVATECKGLPLALAIVGTVLINEKRKNFWENALVQLKSANPITMPDVLNEVYKPLKLSYDSLENQLVRSLFLLCCIFPEDWNINLDDLTMYGIGLCMFEGISVQEARNSICVLLEMLKGRSLLLDGRDENHVKMHDVVRDVARLIASEEELVGQNLSNCKWISVIGEQINKLPIDLSFPGLRLFLMDSLEKYSRPVEISINSSFFQGMEKLNVLYFRCISSRSLPETTQLLKNLRTLYLNCCISLKTISIVGELSSLEILICRNCYKIAELPVEIGRLERLKLLEVSQCENLKRIAPEVISKLVQLEELIIVGSFVEWERKENGKQRNNAALCELEHLKNLTRLDIEIEDLSLVTEDMCFSTKIVNHHIRFMSESMINFYHHGSSMDLILGKDITLARWIHVFLRSTHSLSTRGDGSNSLDLAQGQNLKRLVYKDCSTVNKLVNITKASNSFGNLKELILFNCSKLSKLFPLSMAKYGLLLLEKLEIEKCEMMEEVFANEENEKDGDQCHMITFPELKSLKLSDLPMLTTFCKGSESIKFPLLNEVSIKGCGNMKSLNSGSCNNLNLEGHDADSFHMFCNQKVSFGSLMEIIIEGLHSTRKLFSSAIIKDGLLQLEYLSIDNCEMMEEVFSNEENGMDGVQYCHTITFPKLKSLSLKYLPRLTSFCKGSENIEFPLLEEIDIINCYKLISLISSTYDNLNLEGHDHNFVPLFCKVSFGRLEEISVRRCDGIRSLFSSSIAANLVNLKELQVWGCKEMVKVIEDSDEEMQAADQKPHCIPFPSLNKLELQNIPKLQSFCNWRCEMQLPSLERLIISSHCLFLKFFTMESVILGNLKEIGIRDCDDISSLFSSSIAKKLVNLEELRISNCNEMVKVIEDIDEEMLTADQNSYLLFPKLKKLVIRSLPKLQSVCNWRRDFQLPSLTDVTIDNCPLLEFITMGSVSFGSLKEIGDQIPLGLFSQLEYIYFEECNGIRSLFSFSISENLVNLNKLYIWNCKEMVKVIEDIDEEMLVADQKPHCILFPSLNKLSLWNLPKLQSFCNWRRDFQLPSLTNVAIDNCSLLEFFTMGSVSTPNLKYLSINSRYKDVGDLNSAIQQLHFETNQHQPISTPKETTSSDEKESEMDQAENEMEKTEMEEETNTSSDIQAGAEGAPEKRNTRGRTN